MAKARRKKEVVMVRPSKLPKNARSEIRINKEVKEYLIANKISIQEIFDNALDKIVPKMEIKTTIVIEEKKTIKKP